MPPIYFKPPNYNMYLRKIKGVCDYFNKKVKKQIFRGSSSEKGV